MSDTKTNAVIIQGIHVERVWAKANAEYDSSISGSLRRACVGYAKLLVGIGVEPAHEGELHKARRECTLTLPDGPTLIQTTPDMSMFLVHVR